MANRITENSSRNNFPNTSTAFALVPLSSGFVVSAAADRTLRIWNVFGKENEKCVTVIETAHEDDAVIHAILLGVGIQGFGRQQYPRRR